MNEFWNVVSISEHGCLAKFQATRSWAHLFSFNQALQERSAPDCIPILEMFRQTALIKNPTVLGYTNRNKYGAGESMGLQRLLIMLSSNTHCDLCLITLSDMKHTPKPESHSCTLPLLHVNLKLTGQCSNVTLLNAEFQYFISNPYLFFFFILHGRKCSLTTSALNEKKKELKSLGQSSNISEN